ncbi:GGDEF domain-containing response regulator [Marinospirillum perlucidum]|uniref:GGDEF domain-containing response regulator n=1 Tax=Marinospirillum perlucidum TaxID=1982602 RepID=UPI000DF19FD7|nr:diguanylate cyclase [Marinospirillum perlucidum]
MLILLADDSRTTAAPVKATLAQKGHEVIHVLDGRAAVDAYQAHQPDLILMDGIMPELDGATATRLIRELEPHTWTPIIILTALDSRDGMLEGLKAGADDYLFKPIDFDVLQARIDVFQRISTLQQSLAGVLDHVYEGIITINSRGLIEQFNKAAEQIFGYSAFECRGRNVKLLMPSPYAEEHDGYLSRYLKEGKPRVIGSGRRVQGRRKNGEIFPMQLAITEINQPEGSLFIGLVKDVSEEEKARKKIEYLAWHDALTGLYNRAAFLEHLQQLLDLAHPEEHALLFIDLDGFKPINDDLGHEAGDEALQQVAQRLRRVLRKQDFLARLGGDEFVVLLSSLPDPELAALVAEKLLACLDSPLTLKAGQAQLGASIGGALFTGLAGDKDQIISQADKKMYEAKRAGKGRYLLTALER